MERIEPVARAYPWGSRTRIPELLGADSPAKSPLAELWFGAHPLAPSTIGGVPLDQVIAADPAGQLGGAGELPFLLKVLAAAAPLSLQAHPTREQAEAGYAAEDAAGIARTAAERNYRDRNHKPELIVALTEFHALAGFRPVPRTRELLAELAIPELDRYTVLLDGADGLRGLFTTWLTLPATALAGLVEAVRARCADYAGAGWVAEVAGTVADLAERYPGDPGVLAALLLNRITLAPGEAAFLGAGNLHAYLDGLGVEIMANSDNVLRGGLTAKHVDVVELLRVLSFEPVADPVVRPERIGALRRYPVPAEEFALTVAEVGGGADTTVQGPAILLVTDGAARIGGAEVPRGAAVWLPAAEAAGVTALDRAEVFIATPGAGCGGAAAGAARPGA
ncbi:mannose-6-phosphate isomerase, class I [Corynebacterium sphenisci]|uniref:mannose-6-phosphate isomerase, class I n=1 Tax=Corynebacterium sphenisci TaxID=191493 RepID=UPI0009528C54|nr:mannose-6-phosphate isomerase, class I [Corynebacterium sphenisci]